MTRSIPADLARLERLAATIEYEAKHYHTGKDATEARKDAKALRALLQALDQGEGGKG